MPDTPANVRDRKPFGSEASRLKVVKYIAHLCQRLIYLGVPLDDSRKEGKGNGERCGRARALPLGSATYHDIVQPFGGHVPNRSKTSERKTMRSTRAIVPDVTVGVKM